MFWQPLSVPRLRLHLLIILWWTLVWTFWLWFNHTTILCKPFESGFLWFLFLVAWLQNQPRILYLGTQLHQMVSFRHLDELKRGMCVLLKAHMKILGDMPIVSLIYQAVWKPFNIWFKVELMVPCWHHPFVRITKDSSTQTWTLRARHMLIISHWFEAWSCWTALSLAWLQLKHVS